MMNTASAASDNNDEPHSKLPPPSEENLWNGDPFRNNPFNIDGDDGSSPVESSAKPDEEEGRLSVSEDDYGVVNIPMVPAFGSNGKFAEYEAQGGSPNEDDDDEDTPLPMERRKLYSKRFPVLFAFLAVAAIVFYASGSTAKRRHHEEHAAEEYFTAPVLGSEEGSKQLLHPKKDGKQKQKHKPKPEGGVYDEIEEVEKKISVLGNRNDDDSVASVKQDLEDQEEELIEHALDTELEKEGVDTKGKKAGDKEKPEGDEVSDADDDDADGDVDGEEEDVEELIMEEIEDVVEGIEEEAGDGSSAEEDDEEEEQEEAAVPSNLVRIKPTAVATIKKSSPDATTGGIVHLSVEGDERISFVRFDLPGGGMGAVARATLELYLTAGGKDAVRVAVDALPHGGKWSEGTVSWNDRVETRGAFLVDLFEAPKKKRYEVDVTGAIGPRTKRITFRLSTEQGGRLDFAGKTWKGGEAMPELVITKG